MGKRKAVIVDDDPRARASLKAALERLGVLVIGEGESGEKAVRLARTLNPDVIFMTISVPARDGIAASIRIMEEAPSPIILLSNGNEMGMIEWAKEAGVMAYLLKPLREEELRPAMEVAISRFREFTTLRQENETLKKTIESRKLIERAKGFLMEREGLTEREAFARIQKKSMDKRMPMVEIAKAILMAEEVTQGDR